MVNIVNYGTNNLNNRPIKLKVCNEIKLVLYLINEWILIKY
jgi:hypothetical protein